MSLRFLIEIWIYSGSWPNNLYSTFSFLKRITCLIEYLFNFKFVVIYKTSVMVEFR